MAGNWDTLMLTVAIISISFHSRCMYIGMAVFNRAAENSNRLHRLAPSSLVREIYCINLDVFPSAPQPRHCSSSTKVGDDMRVDKAKNDGFRRLELQP